MTTTPRVHSSKTPLGLAARHDKARGRGEKLRAEADKLDAKAAELERQFNEEMARYLPGGVPSTTGKPPSSAPAADTPDHDRRQQ